MDSDDGLQTAVLYSFKDTSVSEFLPPDLTIHQKSLLHLCSILTHLYPRWVPDTTYIGDIFIMVAENITMTSLIATDINLVILSPVPVFLSSSYAIRVCLHTYSKG